MLRIYVSLLLSKYIIIYLFTFNFTFVSFISFCCFLLWIKHNFINLILFPQFIWAIVLIVVIVFFYWLLSKRLCYFSFILLKNVPIILLLIIFKLSVIIRVSANFVIYLIVDVVTVVIVVEVWLVLFIVRIGIWDIWGVGLKYIFITFIITIY